MKNLECFLHLYTANKSTGKPDPNFKKIQLSESEKDNSLSIFNELFRGINGDFRIIGYSLHINNINKTGFISA